MKNIFLLNFEELQTKHSVRNHKLISNAFVYTSCTLTESVTYIATIATFVMLYWEYGVLLVRSFEIS